MRLALSFSGGVLFLCLSAIAAQEPAVPSAPPQEEGLSEPDESTLREFTLPEYPARQRCNAKQSFPEAKFLADFTLLSQLYSSHRIGKYDGSDPTLPIYVGLWGRVFDVSSHPSGAKFYSPGKAYAHFAGRDITRATAMFSTDEKHLDRAHFPKYREKNLAKSYKKTYVRKYRIVGKFVNPNPPTDDELREDDEAEDKAKRREEEKENNKLLIEKARKQKAAHAGGLSDTIGDVWRYLFGDSKQGQGSEL